MMKKYIIKLVIGLVFVVGAIVSFNSEAKANVAADDDCQRGAIECNRVYDSNWNVTIYYKG